MSKRCLSGRALDAAVSIVGAVHTGAVPPRATIDPAADAQMGYRRIVGAAAGLLGDDCPFGSKRGDAALRGAASWSLHRGLDVPVEPYIVELVGLSTGYVYRQIRALDAALAGHPLLLRPSIGMAPLDPAIAEVHRRMEREAMKTDQHDIVELAFRVAAKVFDIQPAAVAPCAYLNDHSDPRRRPGLRSLFALGAAGLVVPTFGAQRQGLARLAGIDHTSVMSAERAVRKRLTPAERDNRYPCCATLNQEAGARGGAERSAGSADADGGGRAAPAIDAATVGSDAGAAVDC